MLEILEAFTVDEKCCNFQCYGKLRKRFVFKA